jgi:hypothetical protein
LSSNIKQAKPNLARVDCRYFLSKIVHTISHIKFKS